MSNPIAIARLEARGSRLMARDIRAQADGIVIDSAKAASMYDLARDYAARAATIEMLLANA